MKASLAEKFFQGKASFFIHPTWRDVSLPRLRTFRKISGERCLAAGFASSCRDPKWWRYQCSEWCVATLYKRRSFLKLQSSKLQVSRRKNPYRFLDCKEPLFYSSWGNLFREIKATKWQTGQIWAASVVNYVLPRNPKGNHIESFKALSWNFCSNTWAVGAKHDISSRVCLRMYTVLGRLLGCPCSHGNIRVPDSRAQYAGAQSGGTFSVVNDALPRYTKGDHF